MKISTTHILLPAFNFNGQSLKLPDECGPIQFQTIRNRTVAIKWSMITPDEACTPVIINSQCSSIKWIERSTKYVLPRIQVWISYRILICARWKKYTEKIITVKYSTYAVVKRKPEKVPTLSAFKAQFGFLAQLIRALHQYRRGQGSSPGKAELIVMISSVFFFHLQHLIESGV